jgi:ribosomal protein S18 acetylase RimI-like enzyme
MMEEISFLGPSDLETLTNVAPDVFDQPVRKDLAREFLEDPRHHLAAATHDGRIVGFASAVHYLHPDKEPELWINEVGVAPDHRGRGIGERLLRAMLHHGRQLGCREAWVLAERDNEPAMRLYGSVGGIRSAGDPVMFSFDL